MKIEPIGDYLYGWDVTAHRYYDAQGNDLGKISYTNDPDVSEWTEFEVGKTYYIKVMAQEDGCFYTLSPVRTKEPVTDCDTESCEGKKTLALTAENIEKYIPGNVNTKWDVYTVTESFTVGTENEITSTDYFVLPYKVCFGDSRLTADTRTTTYATTDHTAQTSWDALSTFTKKPCEGKEGIPQGSYVQAANRYAYVTDGDPAKATSSYNVYVPSGKRIKLADNGCFYPLPVNERFNDVFGKAWYTEAVEWCAENKFMNGTSGNKFSPSTPLTRAQFVMILANLEGADLDAYKNMQSFSDVPKGRWFSASVEWAKDAMMTAVSAGLISGMTKDTLAPRNNASRAQISLIIKRFYENYLSSSVPSVNNGNYLLEGGTCGYSFYNELLTLAGKDDPRVLYIGMACTDPTDGYESIKASMENWSDNCSFDILLLEDLPTDAARQKIQAADIIYVTGGSSAVLLERLRRYGTDAVIREAAANGTVMSGSSAGAICFGNYGTSGIRDNRFENLYGTGCVDVIVCPHGEETKRVEEMKQLILEDATLVGVAIDYACLEISNGMYRIYTEEGYRKPGTGIRYWNENGEIRSEDINFMEWRPLEELYN